MDLLDETVAAYEATAKMALFVIVHQPTHEAYLKSIKPNPTKKDRQRFLKEMETLRLFGEMMGKEVRLMGIPEQEREHVESSRQENR